MIKIPVRVVYLNGTVKTAVTRLATEVAFERRFNKPLAALIANAPQTDGDGNVSAESMGSYLQNLKMEEIYFLGWHAARAEKPFDEWLDDVDEITFGTADAVDPTNQGPSAGS